MTTCLVVVVLKHILVVDAYDCLFRLLDRLTVLTTVLLFKK